MSNDSTGADMVGTGDGNGRTPADTVKVTESLIGNMLGFELL